MTEYKINYKMGDFVRHISFPKSVGVVYKEYFLGGTYVCDVHWLCHPEIEDGSEAWCIQGKYLSKFKPWPGFYKECLTDNN